MLSDSEALRHLLLADTRAGRGIKPPVGSLLVPGLTILHHPDLGRIGERVTLPGLASGREELLSRREPAFAPLNGSVLRPLADPYLSRRPLCLKPGSAPGSILLARAGSGTTIDVAGVPVAGDLEISAREVERGAVLLLSNRIVLLLSRLDPVGAAGLPDFGLVGGSAAVASLRREIRRVAGLDIPVLLRGETGTGKELVAQALHKAGPRPRGPFLALNMAAIPPSLAAAELFGSGRGAFTGADRKRAGYFQRADGGTLFLDEVGETPPEVQVLLLRALETGEVQPVGGEEPVPVDVRLIAATDADLEGAVAAGRFRAPLLHRLAGYEIRVPPLRERRDDFGRLFFHFLGQELAKLGESERLATSREGQPWIPAALVARLARQDWPGNVRQLRNAVRQIVIAGRDSGEAGMWLQAEHLCQEAEHRERPEGAAAIVAIAAPGERSSRTPRKTYRPAEEASEEELLAVLRANRWRIQRAAAQLGISRTSLYERIEKSPNLRKAGDLGRDEIQACRRRCRGDLDAMAEALEVSKRGLQRRMAQLGIL